MGRVYVVDIEQTIGSLFRHFNERIFTAVVEHFADDAELWFLGKRVASSRDQVKDALGGWIEHFMFAQIADYTVVPEPKWAKGQRGAVVAAKVTFIITGWYVKTLPALARTAPSNDEMVSMKVTGYVWFAADSKGGLSITRLDCIFNPNELKPSSM